jgi:hypothetical protein
MWQPDLIPESWSTEWVNPYPIKTPVAGRLLKFKTNQRVGRGQPMNEPIRALPPSAGLLLNCQSGPASEAPPNAPADYQPTLPWSRGCAHHKGVNSRRMIARTQARYSNPPALKRPVCGSVRGLGSG